MLSCPSQREHKGVEGSPVWLHQMHSNYRSQHRVACVDAPRSYPKQHMASDLARSSSSSSSPHHLVLGGASSTGCASRQLSRASHSSCRLGSSQLANLDMAAAVYGTLGLHGATAATLYLCSFAPALFLPIPGPRSRRSQHR